MERIAKALTYSTETYNRNKSINEAKLAFDKWESTRTAVLMAQVLITRLMINEL